MLQSDVETKLGMMSVELTVHVANSVFAVQDTQKDQMVKHSVPRYFDLVCLAQMSDRRQFAQ